MNKNNKMSGRSSLLKDNTENVIIAECTTMLCNTGFNDYYLEQFTGGTTCLLNDYAELVGEGTFIEYTLTKKLSKIELRLLIPGASYDPFISGNEARQRKFESLAGINLNHELVSISYKYESGCNVICVSLPLSERKKPFFKNPMVLAISLGVALGFLCLILPDTIRSFIIDDVASPVKSIILNIISGIMGPVIFISITTSIVALESINDLTDLAFKILKRFVLIILFMIIVSVGISACFFHNFGTGEMSFEPSYIIELILSILPTNVVDPFLNSNIPQLVILGILLGSALLILGDKVKSIKEILMQVNEWAKSVMKIVLTAIPLIPFLSLLTTIGSGKGSEILEGWKFIAAAYIVFTISVAFKAVKTSLVTGIRLSDFWKKVRPVVMTSFLTGSNTAAMNKIYEVSDKELGIKPEFTSFWTAMWSAMLSIKTAVYLVIPTLMVAEMSGMALTTSFLFTMVFVTLELSLASPGPTTSLTIMFTVLGLSTDYVGLFSVYRVATDNYCTACAMAHNMLEQYEAAHKFGCMKEGQETKTEKHRAIGKRKNK